jgi:hypothetical protein
MLAISIRYDNNDAEEIRDIPISRWISPPSHGLIPARGRLEHFSLISC